MDNEEEAFEKFNQQKVSLELAVGDWAYLAALLLVRVRELDLMADVEEPAERIVQYIDDQIMNHPDLEFYGLNDPEPESEEDETSD